MASARKKEIKKILQELSIFPRNISTDYARYENILFFESLANPFRYFKWLIDATPRIQRTDELFEINELLTQYDEQMHHGLVAVERATFPKLIEPLVHELYLYIKNNNEPVTLLCLGAGGMEVERQIICRLKLEGWNGSLLFVCVDRSPKAHSFARKNLAETNVPIVFKKEIRNKEIIEMNTDQGIKILQCTNDIFALDKYFASAKFDLVYNSFFLHHLSYSQRTSLNKIMQIIAKTTIIYDGYRSSFHLLPQSLVAWNNPILMNASIFSGLRYLSKKEIQSKWNNVHYFSKQGTFLTTISDKNPHI